MNVYDCRDCSHFKVCWLRKKISDFFNNLQPDIFTMRNKEDRAIFFYADLMQNCPNVNLEIDKEN